MEIWQISMDHRKMRTNEQDTFIMDVSTVSSMNKLDASHAPSSDISARQSNISTSSGGSIADAGKTHDNKKGITLSRREVPYV
ncbi:unnamed protein product [Ilex paraguariensis]|uniref:Uncharacterized protein n=1 Tax=Ilex paraguariensis TaxID=185542 RepID=A0ABC8RAY2_9AQUA